ncbi:hypothetical protein FW796_20565 [Pseudomonas sp. 910_21]
MPSTPAPAPCTDAGPTPDPPYCRRNPGSPCRSRLAGEEARKPCTKTADAFAGKPAPTAPT